ncbi:MAG: TIGR03862 family flavoprotein [Paracoccaceae bacterium]
MVDESRPAVVIGAGPAGLAAAEALAAAGHPPVVLEAKPSVARKFLMAGKSGLNLTKDEAEDAFLAAFGTAAPRLAPILRAFGPQDCRAWAEGLGEALFTGSSGRVFPHVMKGSPLLRRWLARLAAAGVEIRTRWRWTGWDGETLRFETPAGPRRIAARATVLALGGASWPRLGSDAAWVPWLEAAGVAVAPFRPANIGIEIAWSETLRSRFAGAPLKPVGLAAGEARTLGECVVTETGLEGSAVYAVSAAIRERLRGACDLTLDLAPGRTEAAIEARLARAGPRQSLANRLRRAGITGVKAALLREADGPVPTAPAPLAARIKALPLTVAGLRPISEAISSAGGVAWDGVDAALALAARPTVFVAGEMLDWEAPTGGYLLTGCLATGFWAGQAAARHLAGGPGPAPAPSQALPIRAGFVARGPSSRPPSA